MGLARKPKVTEVIEKLEIAITPDAHKGTSNASPGAAYSWRTMQSQVGEQTQSHS